MASAMSPASGRFVVRMGRVGWMVYDRERKGPALLGTDWIANLTREQAERAYEILVGSDGPERGSQEFNLER